jgi:acetone carboxylase gamma subunit
MRLTSEEKLELISLKERLRFEQEKLIKAKKENIDSDDDIIVDLEDNIFIIQKNITELQY